MIPKTQFYLNSVLILRKLSPVYSLILGAIVGGLLATCSREKIEDEMTQQLRLSSLLTALYINYAALIVCSLLLYDMDFLSVMIYNMFTPLIIFMVVFRWKIWRKKKALQNE